MTINCNYILSTAQKSCCISFVNCFHPPRETGSDLCFWNLDTSFSACSQLMVLFLTSLRKRKKGEISIPHHHQAKLPAMSRCSSFSPASLWGHPPLARWSPSISAFLLVLSFLLSAFLPLCEVFLSLTDHCIWLCSEAQKKSNMCS